MKIILAFDSFKGSLSANEAVEAAVEGVLEAIPDAEIVALPLADGGEGSSAALCRFLDARWQTCSAHDPLMRKIQAEYAISRDGKTAIIESAATAGITLLGLTERNPMKTSTFGLGEMMMDAMGRGCTRLLIGLGGSATNDGGMGMLSALGVRFHGADETLLEPKGESLTQIASVNLDGLADLSGVSIEAICDVQNPLHGPEGAAHVYAPQKGANADEVEILDEGLRNLEQVCHMSGDVPGCGAAGGLGYALLLLGATLRRGGELILDAADFDNHLSGAALVLTGEGRLDSQTLCGKLPFCVLKRAHAHRIPTIALAGSIADAPSLLCAGFHSVHSINPPSISLPQALNPDTARHNLRLSVRKVLAAEIHEK